MKAFIIALAAVAVISVGSGVILTLTDSSTGESFASDAVRLSE